MGVLCPAKVPLVAPIPIAHSIAVMRSEPAPFQSHAAAAARRGPLTLLRQQCFGSPASAAFSLLMLALLLWLGPKVLAWAVLNAVWSGPSEACRAAAGACWAVVAEKYRLILLGRYPSDEQWRPVLASGLLLGLLLASSLRRNWHQARRLWLGAAWLLGAALFVLLMRGGLLGLAKVGTDLWGGLPLTLLLSTVAIAGGFVLGVLLALGRQSALPAVRSSCTVYIELVRGVPLVSVLFMAAFMFPLLLPPGWQIDVLLRVLLALVLFTAAYNAEVVRGGLQAVPATQTEAAKSLGMTYWQTQSGVVLPQALAYALPGLVNNFIGIFKDTSLVTIVSLYELSGALGLALDSDADWRPFKLEGYLFIASVYFCCCLAMSLYSQRMEQARAASQR
jgi:general L-amino acid transport system permease protein